jgi:hypothetical protein
MPPQEPFIGGLPAMTPTAIAAITSPITNIVIKNSVMCLLFVCEASYACDSLR